MRKICMSIYVYALKVLRSIFQLPQAIEVVNTIEFFDMDIVLKTQLVSLFFQNMCLPGYDEKVTLMN